MTKHEMEKFRVRLRTMAERIQGTPESDEVQARAAMGGEAAGDLSNTPMWERHAVRPNHIARGTAELCRPRERRAPA